LLVLQDDDDNHDSVSINNIISIYKRISPKVHKTADNERRDASGRAGYRMCGNTL